MVVAKSDAINKNCESWLLLLQLEIIIISYIPILASSIYNTDYLLYSDHPTNKKSRREYLKYFLSLLGISPVYQKHGLLIRLLLWSAWIDCTRYSGTVATAIIPD